MDVQSKAMLDEILAKSPADLTDSDKDILRARSSYLNEEQKAVYADILDVFLPEPEVEDELDEPVAPKRGRKAKVE